MRRHALAAVAGLAALTASASAQTAAPNQTPQQLFTRLVLADDGATSAIRSGLKARRLTVDQTVEFADLTGDGRPDAIVRVQTGGAAGAIAVFVFSAQGSKPDANGDVALRAVYRSQSLYRATVRRQGSALLVLTPVYAPGDAVCCPARQTERTLTYSTTAGRLVLRATRRVDVPVRVTATP